MDDHAVWYRQEPPTVQAELSQQPAPALASAPADWQAISERVLVDLQTASQEWGERSASLLQNIAEVNRETYDYSDFLRKFVRAGRGNAG